MELIKTILLGASCFPALAIVWTLPLNLILLVKYRTFNKMRIILNYAMLLYILCVAALVFLPLPTAQEAANLHVYEIQWIPFHFIMDIIKESPLQWNRPSTYLPAITNYAILQVIFNVFMMIPFGMFFKYYCRYDVRKIIIISFLFSLFIEVTQGTGLYGIYHGSYRLCDVDDLMANTLGGYIGCQFINAISKYLPSITKFDHTFVAAKSHSVVRR